MAKETLESMLEYFLNVQLKQIILSNPVDKKAMVKVRIRPVMLKGQLLYQAEELTGTQAFHRNMAKEETKDYIGRQLSAHFRQAEVFSLFGSATVLVSKKGSMMVKTRRVADAGQQQEGQEQSEREEQRQARQQKKGQTGKGGQQPDSQGQSRQPDHVPDKRQVARMEAEMPVLSHNRQKHYVLREGMPVPFLVDLGVMTQEGKIVRNRYDKFRQINRFLEFIEDILPKLDKGRENVIIDFGCGKSYLTFAMYYYLNQLKGYPIRVIGLDLKRDVISRCNQLAERYGFENLHFYHGDIATYEGVEQVDMVVTLHACDTATDFAMAKAVGWGAKVILSVPCCQHELNRQMHSDLMKPFFQYGLIRERVAALYTDAFRAELLESCGYRTQVMEFIDMEHTPKNILIRAVYDGRKKENREELERLKEFLHVEPTLMGLLWEKERSMED